MDKTENTKWVRLGDYIEVYDRKNTDGKPYPFFGINKDKAFMPTVANTNELDNTKYKVVKNGVFVFSGMQTGRDICIRIAVYDGEKPILVSPAYTTFKVKDSSELSPTYLFLQFNRNESDRYGWFLSDGSIRSNLDWDRFCDIEIPLPPIEVQQELVDAYNGIKAIAEQNEALCQRLSAACHAYIVDCRAKYPTVSLGDYIEQCNIRNSNDCKMVLGMSTTKEFRIPQNRVDYSKLLSYKVVEQNHFVFVPTTDTWKCLAIALSKEKQTFVVSPIYVVFKLISNDLLPDFLNLFFKRKEFDRYARYHSWGSARENFSFDDICKVKIPLPSTEVQKAIVELYNCAERAKKIATEARERLKTLCPALIQRAANS